MGDYPIKIFAIVDKHFFNFYSIFQTPRYNVDALHLSRVQFLLPSLFLVVLIYHLASPIKDLNACPTTTYLVLVLPSYIVPDYNDMAQ